jgi:hypothetical protein
MGDGDRGLGLLREAEWGAKRVLIGVGIFLLATLVVCVPVGVLGSSNLVWGEANQYGRVDVPGRATLDLPARTIDVEVALDIVGKGNETVDVPLPSNLALTVTPAAGEPAPSVVRDVGDSGNTNDDGTNSQRRIYKVDMAQAGAYNVVARGDFRRIGLNAQFWFGHGPPIPGTLVPLIAAALVAVGFIVWLVFRPLLARRRAGP